VRILIQLQDKCSYFAATIQTSTVVLTSTLSATSTVTVAAITAPCTETVFPQPVIEQVTRTVTWHRNRFTHTVEVLIETKTAQCTYPYRAERRDSHIRYNPKRFMPAVLKSNDYQRRSQDQHRVIIERASDAPTITSTVSPPVSVTTTLSAPTVTNTFITQVTTTSFTTLPPSTVKTGISTITTTLPPPTRTNLTITYLTATSTSTISKTSAIHSLFLRDKSTDFSKQMDIHDHSHPESIEIGLRCSRWPFWQRQTLVIKKLIRYVVQAVRC
jgi:hypothetical protein